MEKTKSVLKGTLIISGIVFFIIHIFTQIVYYKTKKVNNNSTISIKAKKIPKTDTISNSHLWEKTEFIN
jgi:hypothetical protein